MQNLLKQVDLALSALQRTLHSRRRFQSAGLVETMTNARSANLVAEIEHCGALQITANDNSLRLMRGVSLAHFWEVAISTGFFGALCAWIVPEPIKG